MKSKDRVLVIDDDQRFLEMVRLMLLDEGYDVTACNSAREGMGKLSGFNPDVLLLDWQMPDTTGLEVITSIRETQKNSDLYIIMLSGKIMTDNIVRAIIAGADDYVIKPFSPEELLARVFNGVRSRKHRSMDDQSRERILKGLQRIETMSQQLSNAVEKDKRSLSLAFGIKDIASDLKEVLKSQRS